MWSTSGKPLHNYPGQVVGGVAATADCGEGVQLVPTRYLIDAPQLSLDVMN